VREKLLSLYILLFVPTMLSHCWLSWQKRHFLW